MACLLLLDLRLAAVILAMIVFCSLNTQHPHAFLLNQIVRRSRAAHRATRVSSALTLPLPPCRGHQPASARRPRRTLELKFMIALAKGVNTPTLPCMRRLLRASSASSRAVSQLHRSSVLQRSTATSKQEFYLQYTDSRVIKACSHYFSSSLMPMTPHAIRAPAWPVVLESE